MVKIIGNRRAVRREPGASQAGGDGEPPRDSEQSKTRLKPSSQGHRRTGRTGEWRASRAEESAHAKALKHARVWHVPRALRKLVWFRE